MYVLLPQSDGSIVLYGFKNNKIIFHQKSRTWLIVEDSQPIDELLNSANTMTIDKIVGTLQLGKFDHHIPIGTHSWNLTDRCDGILSLKLTHVSMMKQIRIQNVKTCNFTMYLVPTE